MFKLILLFNLKKLILNKEIEQLYFAETHKKDIGTNLKTLEAKITKLKEKTDDKSVVELSKLEADVQRITNIQNTYTNFSLEITYFSGLAETIKANFWKLF